MRLPATIRARAVTKMKPGDPLNPIPVKQPRHAKQKMCEPTAVQTDSSISITIPLVTVSEKNTHEHGWWKGQRVKQQRNVVGLELLSYRYVLKPFKPPLVVKLTRLGPKKLDDDNLRQALSAVRDEIAKFFGIDDADPRIKYDYGQEPGKPYGVVISFARAAGAAGRAS